MYVAYTCCIRNKMFTLGKMTHSALLLYDLAILGVTFDSKMTFEKHLRSVSRAASHGFGILKNSWRVFMIERFLGDAFGVLSCQFWNIVLQSGARLPIHTLNYWTEQSVVPGF